MAAFSGVRASIELARAPSIPPRPSGRGILFGSRKIKHQTEANKMNKWHWMLSLLIAGILAGCGGGEESGEARTLRVACVLPAEHPSSEALAFFERRLEERSSGKIDVQLFLNGQLGNSTETIEGVQRGNIELTVVSAAPLSQFVPSVNALAMPYLFRSTAHQHTVLDGAVGDTIASRVRREAGLKTLAFFDAGTRNIMTKSGPVKEPQDLQGKKIRVMPSKLMVDAVNALGASAVPMDQGEVYGALQTGVLDGWENNAPTALTFNMHETGADHFAWTRHLSIPDFFVMDPEVYENLSDTLRTQVNQVVRETIEEQRRLWKDYEQKAVRHLKEEGMNFNEVDQALFAAEVQPIYGKYYRKYGDAFKRLCQQVQGMQADSTVRRASPGL